MRTRERTLRSEQGAVFVQVGISLFVLMSFNVFVLDYGMMWIGRRQAQNAADAGALAGAVARGYDDFDDPPSVERRRRRQRRGRGGSKPRVAAGGHASRDLRLPRRWPRAVRQGGGLPRRHEREHRPSHAFRPHPRDHEPEGQGVGHGHRRQRERDRLPAADCVRGRLAGQPGRPARGRWNSRALSSRVPGRRCQPRRLHGSERRRIRAAPQFPASWANASSGN